MGKAGSLCRGFGRRMQRMVFCFVIVSAARHTGVSAYFDDYSALAHTGEEPPQLPNDHWERSNPPLRPENAWMRGDIAEDKYILDRLARLIQDPSLMHARLSQNPEFTYHFPDAASEPRQYVRDAFAVRPSDPRYYQHDHSVNVASSKKENNDDGFERSSKANDETTPMQDDNADYENGNIANALTNVQTNEEGEGGSSVLKAILTPDSTDEIIFLAITAGLSAIAVVSLISLFICWLKLHRSSKATADVEYPAYGVTGPNKELSPTGDRRLAQSAQMYHYQHQKQQIIAMESSRANNERRGSVSEADSDEENEEGDYTVYECPGLAAQTGEMEVKNPLFQDDPTPAPDVQVTADETK